MSPFAVERITVYPLRIPLRVTVSHATSARATSDAMVTSVRLPDGTVGYGETLPRTYVTGENVASVLDAIRNVYAPALTQIQPDSFPAALEAIEALPWRDGARRLIPAARAAVELALLDAVLRVYGRGMDHVVQWMGLPGFGSPGSAKHIRFGGVLAAKSIAATLRQLRLMYWGGLRHFKLKVGGPGDHECLVAVARYLRRAIEKGKATLRLDANGAWSREGAMTWLAEAAAQPVASVEQPLARGQEEQLTSLRTVVDWPIMHDESLITMDDAQRLIDLGVADGFNIRISKCGGLLPSLRLAAYARRSGVRIQLGCMVGETSVLSAAGLRFLQVCPAVRWAEGCFGSFLMRGDIVVGSLRFGYGGRPPRLTGRGLGVRADSERLNRFCPEGAVVFDLGR